MRFLAFFLMITAATSSVTAASLTGVWRLVEVNSLPMQETPPYGQINRKEIYTLEGELLVARPDAPFADAAAMGHYEVKDGVRVLTPPEGGSLATPVQWIDDDHFFLEFNPGECWYYARVSGDNASEQQWEPRSVAVIRMTEDGSGPTLRDFPFDLTDDTKMPWAKRVFGAWEMIRVAGRSVSGPDTPPYGMPNERLLIGADETMRKVQATGEGEGEDAEHIKVEGNKLTMLESGLVIYFWFNHWGQLVFEQQGTQMVYKRISLDATKAPAGPVVVVLLSGEREEQKLVDGKLVEMSKIAGAAISKPFPVASNAPHSAAGRVARPKVTFRKPFNGGSRPGELALADNDDALNPENELNVKARLAGLGSTSDILATNEDEKFSLIRADAIDSNFEVPFGWHVADNGDRMLVFDDDHFIEVSIEQRTAKAGAKALLQELLDAQKAVQPDLKSQLIDNADDSFLLIMQNFQDGDEIKTRSFMTHNIGQGATFIVAQINAGTADMVRALNLTEAMMRHFKYQP